MKNEKDIKKLETILNLIREGNNFGLGLEDVEKKIASAIKDLNDDMLNVVLFGSFSDGKTTVAAGWLEEEFDNMKIDANESSDQICIYNATKKNVRIIDTPGLFGDKEKTVDNEIIKYEEQTKKYISEAHLILYVVEAVNPIKESHKEVIKWVLKDLDKLEQTIFVINKMDNVANLEDEIDFRRNAEIKTKVIQDTLKSFIELTNTEIEKLKIVCVSANPYNEKFKDWLTNINEYRELSHLLDLKEVTENIVNENEKYLKKAVSKSVIKDVVLIKTNELNEIITNEKLTIAKERSKLEKISTDLGFLKTDAGRVLRQAKENIRNLRESIFTEINAATREDYYSLIERNLGIKKVEKKIEVGYLLTDKIQGIIDEAVESLEGQTLELSFLLEESIKEINESISRMATSGLKNLLKNSGKIPVNTIRDAILKGRDALKLSTKFKPWGAVKLAKNFAKGAAALGALLEVFTAVWDKYQEKKFLKQKQDMKNSLESVFSDLLKDLGSTDKFINQYVPSYNILNSTVEDLQKKNISFEEKLKESDVWKKKLHDFFDAEDIPFEEI